MNKLFKSGIMGLAMASSLAVTAAPAAARPYYRHHHRGGDDAAIAIGAGIIGLGIGAAIASGSRDRYYDPYYGGSYYGGSYGYGSYYDGYYGRPYRSAWGYGARRAYRPHCRTAWRWDPYRGRDVRVRVCR